MTHVIVSTLSVAALGLFAARASDCSASSDSAASLATTRNRKEAAWEFKPDAAQQKVRGSGCSAMERVETCTGIPSGEPDALPRHPLSASSNFRFRSTPHRYPVSDPLAPTTRWQGTTSATRFIAQARATARVAFGSPISRATSL